MSQPILSICIPTYNRAQYLKTSLDSIVSQDGFKSGQVEIVISDNCSTDSTEELCTQYTTKFSMIKYYRNNQNIRDQNFPTVLNKATGLFRKLSNDSIIYNPGAIKNMLDIIKSNIEQKPIIFFMMDDNSKPDEHFTTLDDFLYCVSFNTTWIAGFGLWQEDAVHIMDTVDDCKSSIWQVPFLLKMICVHVNSVVIHYKLFYAQAVVKKDISYGLYNVFYKNYLKYNKEFLDKGLMSQRCFDFLKRDLLYNFFTNWMITFDTQRTKYKYNESEDLTALVFKAYEREPYYRSYCVFYKKCKLVRRAKVFVKRLIGRMHIVV